MSLSKLREEGLFELIPWLDDEKHKIYLAGRVQNLRGSLFNVPHPISAKYGALALWIASLFAGDSGELVMPMFIALLSLWRRNPMDERFLRIVQTYAGESDILRLFN